MSLNKYIKYKNKYNKLKNQMGGQPVWTLGGLLTKQRKEKTDYGNIITNQTSPEINVLVNNYIKEHCNNNSTPKPKNILFINFPEIKKYGNNINEKLYNVFYVGYKDISDGEKILKLITEYNFDYIIIIILNNLSDDKIECIKLYASIINNPLKIMVLYNSLFTIKRLTDDNLYFNDKLLILCDINIKSLYLIKYNKVLNIPVRYINRYNFERLSDTWWYQYTINKFFACSNERLRQLSGTCFANATFNCIILTKYLKASFLHKMKHDIDIEPELLKLVINFDIKSEIYNQDCKEIIYGFFYKVLCDKQELNISKPPYDRDDCDPEDYIVRITKALVDYKGKGGYKVSLFSNELYKIVYNDYYTTTINNTSLNNSILNYPSEGTFKIFYELKKITVQPGYTPCACVIVIQQQLELRTVKPSSHGVCGYICNDQKIIYDSARNTFDYIDWTQESLLKELNFVFTLSNIYKFYNYGVVYYVKNEYIKYIDSHRYDSMCPILSLV